MNPRDCRNCPHQHLYWVEHHGPEQLLVIVLVGLAFLVLWTLFRDKEEND